MKARPLYATRAVYSRYLALLISLLLIAGCGPSLPEKLGINAANWESMSFIEKSNLMAQYDQSQSLHDAFYRGKSINNGKVIAVKITQGRAVIWPTIEPLEFKDISYTLSQNSCSKIPIIAKDEHVATTFESCFWGDELLLDPSPTNIEYATSSARFFHSSLWHNFVYKDISTSGYISFSHINLAVKILEAS